MFSCVNDNRVWLFFTEHQFGRYVGGTRLNGIFRRLNRGELYLALPRPLKWLTRTSAFIRATDAIPNYRLQSAQSKKRIREVNRLACVRLRATRRRVGRARGYRFPRTLLGVRQQCAGSEEPRVIAHPRERGYERTGSMASGGAQAHRGGSEVAAVFILLERATRDQDVPPLGWTMQQQEEAWCLG